MLSELKYQCVKLLLMFLLAEICVEYNSWVKIISKKATFEPQYYRLKNGSENYTDCSATSWNTIHTGFKYHSVTG